MEQIPLVPTLYPSEEEFNDPISYLSSPDIASKGARYGMVKIVPPQNFKPPLSISKKRFRFVPRIQKLRELNLQNRCRLFYYKQLLNFNKMHILPLPKYTYEMVDTKRVYYYDFFIAAVKFLQPAGSDEKSLPDISSSEFQNNLQVWLHLSATFNLSSTLLQNLYHSKLEKYFNFLSKKSEFSIALVEEKYPSSLLFDDSSSEAESDEEDEEGCLICKNDTDHDNMLLCDSCDKPYHKYCISPPLSEIPKHNWYCDNCVIGNGHYGFKDSTFEYSLEDFKDLSDDFDKEFFKNKCKPDIETMEKIFWNLVNDHDNNIKINYGADIHNQRRGEVSGFPTRDFYTPKSGLTRAQYMEYANHPMNLNNLSSAEGSLLNFLKVDISGMTIPWIYVGNTFSTFCWHVEDQYTLSANYQHFGATKKWYSIPSTQAQEFENYIKDLAPDLFAKQPDILHQLVTLVSPFELNQAKIQCYTANQEPGEYIVTYPRVYHAGFNAGYNFNEAVNFTMTGWLEFGVDATNNYKKELTKSSVFDIWEMMISILNLFDEGVDIDLELIKKVLSMLKSKLDDAYALNETMEEIFENKAERKKNESEICYDKKDLEHKEDGITCEKCKSFCTFSYIKHYVPLIREKAIKSEYPTPRTTPDESRKSKRIKLQNDHDSYKIQILCLEDYLTVEHHADDEFHELKDLTETKNLIQRVDLRVQDLL